MTAGPPPSVPLARRVLRGAAYLGVAQYGVTAIELVKTAVLGRLILPELHGVVFLAMSTVSFLTLFRMDLREIVISDSEGRQARLFTQYVVEVATALAGVLVALAAYAVAPRLAVTLNQPDLADARVWQAVAAFIAVNIATALTSTPLYILHRDIRQAVITRLTLLGALLSLAASVAAAWWSHPVLALVLAFGLQPLVLGVGAWLVVGWRPVPAWDAAAARDSLGFAFTLWTNGLLGKVTFELDDQLVGWGRGPRALGFYAKAYALAKMPMDLFAGLIGGIALSMYARSRAAGAATLNRAYTLTTWLLARVVAWSSVVVLAAAEEIVALILGPGWEAVPPLVRLMALYVLGRPLFQNNAQLLVATRREKLVRRAQALQAVILVLAAPFAVARWGAAGASVAVSVMMVAGFALSQVYAARAVRTPLLRLYALPFALALILAPAVYWLGGRLPAVEPAALAGVLRLGVKGLAATVVFGGAVWLAERDTARQVLALLRANLLPAGGRAADAGPPAAT